MRITPTYLEECIRSFYGASLFFALFLYPLILVTSHSNSMFVPSPGEILKGLLLLIASCLVIQLLTRRWDCKDIYVNNGNLIVDDKVIALESVTKICEVRFKAPKRGDWFFALHLDSGEAIHFQERLSLGDYNPIKRLRSLGKPFSSFTFREMTRAGLSPKFSEQNERV